MGLSSHAFSPDPLRHGPADEEGADEGRGDEEGDQGDEGYEGDETADEGQGENGRRAQEGCLEEELEGEDCVEEGLGPCPEGLRRWTGIQEVGRGDEEGEEGAGPDRLRAGRWKDRGWQGALRKGQSPPERLRACSKAIAAVGVPRGGLHVFAKACAHGAGCLSLGSAGLA